MSLTITKEEARSFVYIVEFGSKSTNTLNTLTSQLQGIAETTDSSHQMPGDENSAMAMARFQQRIKLTSPKERWTNKPQSGHQGPSSESRIFQMLYYYFSCWGYDTLGRPVTEPF
jgi:hypothetical protein